jgi:hypothetical protein
LRKPITANTRAGEKDGDVVRAEEQQAGGGEGRFAGRERGAGIGQRRHQGHRDCQAGQGVGHVLAGQREGSGQVRHRRRHQVEQMGRRANHDLLDRLRLGDLGNRQGEQESHGHRVT